MALNPQFKVNKLAKDLGMKSSKELTDILTANGMEVKTQRNLEPAEFDVLFETLTRSHQISNIEDYLDGLTVIPSKLPRQASAETGAEQPKEAAKPQTSNEKTNAEAPKAEPARSEAPAATEKKHDDKPLDKPLDKPAEKPAEKAVGKTADKSAGKTAGKPAEKPAEKPIDKPIEKPAEKTAEKPAEKAAEKTVVQPAVKAENTAKATPADNKPATEKAEAPRTAPKAENGTAKAAASAGAASARQTAPAASRPAPATRPQDKAPLSQDRPRDKAPASQDRPRADFNRNDNRNDSRRDGTNTARPAQNGAPSRPGQNGVSPANRPANGSVSSSRPDGNRAQGSSDRAQGGNFRTGAGQGGFAPRQDRPQGSFDRPQGGFGGGSQQRSGNSRPGQNRGNSGGNGGGFDKDHEYAQVGGLKDTFHAQATIRVQKNDGTPVVRGETRLVDTRSSVEFDSSKYDERLESFVSDRDRERQGAGGKVKRQQPGAARGTTAKPEFNKNNKKKKNNEPVHIAPQNVTLPEEIAVSDLASALKVRSADVIKVLFSMGTMATVNQVVDYDTAALVADSLGISVSKQVVVSIEEKLFDPTEDNDENLETRAPVVCVMGHVDHGKTSLLDAIRHTHVTAGEAGGITQAIGAYRVRIKGQDITFLDTPGHEAFTAMRARGAQATDIAILVVAADDGIMPQTIEAIHHAKAAGIDIIVAINKMDKPGANPEGIKQELTKYDLVPEEWGGDVMCVPVSALTGQGIDDLLENVLLVAEVKELKANPNRRAKGIVIEAKLDKGRGPVATVLVQNGTLHDGDIVIAGTAVGRVRAMTDHRGKGVRDAGPSVPVEITGLSEVPVAGDEFQAVEDERMARTLADSRKNKAKEEGFRANARANLNDLFEQISEGVKNLNIIVKGDVVGSAEAVKQSLLKISNEEVKVCVIHAAAGGINEGDVMLAAASNAIIVGFNVRPDKAALDNAERQGVDIRTYRIIYDCIEEITAAMKGMLAPKFTETLLGHAEVRQTIHVPNVGTIAGSYITDGKVTRASKIRVLRDSVVIFEDEVSSLKRFKDDAKEVAQGFECGVGLSRFNDIKVGDILEAYIMEEVKQ